MTDWIEKAKAQRAVMDSAGAMLSDKQASTVVSLYGGMHYGGELIKAGDRISWKAALKRAAVDLWDREENNPDNAPALWENLPYKEGIRIIPEVITAGLAFSRDELGWWRDVVYKSLLDSNTWTPDEYPAGWEVAEP
jgi:hypothetical protein